MQFFAILKDSFREAIDGFVIYLMLGLSLLLILLAASISYSPDPADKALPDVVGQFNIIFPDRGASRSPTGVPGSIAYSVRDARQEPDGSVRCTLAVNGLGPVEVTATTTTPDGKTVDVTPKRTGTDMFRYSVVAWKSPPGEKIVDPRRNNRNRNKARGKSDNELEIVMPPTATKEDLRRVTDEDMTAFLKNQFALFAGVSESDVEVTRRSTAEEEPNYTFDVKLKSVSGARGWPHSVHLLFGVVPPLKGIPLGLTLYFIQDQIVNGIGALVTLMISVVITAFFIPNMLRKGSIDLLVSKPIARVQLLVYKYIGGLTFMFLVTAFTIGGVWLVMAARSGVWDPAFLLVIPALTFTFAILYAVSTTVAVYTRSAIAAILITFGFMFLMWMVGQAKSFFDMNRVNEQFDLPEWSYTLVDTINNCSPRYKDLDKLTTKVIVDANLPVGLSRLMSIFTEFPSWTGAVSVSLIFIAVMLGLSSLRFVKRDY